MGTLIKLGSGGTPRKDKKEFWGGSIPWISFKDLKSPVLNDSEDRITELGAVNGTKVVPSGTILFPVRGMGLAKHFPVCRAGTRVAFNQDLKCVSEISTEISAEYLYYFLRGSSEAIRALADEAAHGTKRIQTDRLLAFNVLYPEDKSVQKRIAHFAQNFDSIIQINERRIRALEGASSALYREWFVDFKFPNYEKIRLIDSGCNDLGMIPDGWKLCNVSEVIERVHPGKLYSNKTTLDSGAVPVFDQGQSGIIGYHNDAPGVIASAEEPIIVFANHTCYQRLIFTPFSAIQNVLPFKSHPNLQRDIYWLHMATNGLVSLNDYKGHWPEFIAKQLIAPSYEVTVEFGKLVKPMFHLIKTLEETNNVLRNLRDLLLPKLIAGEIDVDHLDIIGMCDEASSRLIQNESERTRV